MLIAFALVLASCQSTPEPNPIAASTRLEPLLEAWDLARREDGGCEQREPMETPLVDCERISLEIARLAIEFPRDPDVLLANAVVQFEAKRPEEAMKSLDALRRYSPANPEAAVLRARIALADGNLRFARRLLDEQLELVPDHPGLWELLAAIHYLRADYSSAERDLDIAERLGAPTWRIAYHRGLVAESASRTDEAAREYSACLEAAPDFAPARSRLRALSVMRSMSPAVPGASHSSSVAETGPVFPEGP